MSFTVKNIQDEVITFADTTLTVDNAKAIAAMKLAVRMIGYKSGYSYQIDSAYYNANSWYDVLPEDVIKVTEVNINDGNNTVYNNWRMNNTKILFYIAGNYIIHYKKVPTEPIAVTSVIEVHPMYKQALFDFMLGYNRVSKWDGEDALGLQLISNFKQEVESIWSQISNHGPAGVRLVVQRGR